MLSVESKYTYCVTSETFWHEDIGDYISHGIIASSENNTITISDISVDRERVENLARKCNENDLEICHFHDVVEDYLAG